MSLSKVEGASLLPPEEATVRWSRGDAAPVAAWPMPSLPLAAWRGARCRCPACGRGDLFRGYLRVQRRCAGCAAPLGLARADDAPPYFTIFVVGHIVVLLMLTVERRGQLSIVESVALWLPITLALSLLLLRPIKGATVGLTMKLGLMRSPTDD